MRRSSTVSTWTKSTARMPRAWAVRNCFQVGPCGGCGADTGVMQDLPCLGGSDRVAEPDEFALHPPVPWRSCGNSGSRPPPPALQHCGTSCSRHQRPSSPGPLASTTRPPARSRSTLARPGTSTPPETTRSHHERPAHRNARCSDTRLCQSSAPITAAGGGFGCQPGSATR